MEISPVNLRTILSESTTIMKANAGHFWALSLFIIPLSISLVITPSLHFHLSGHILTVDLFLNFLKDHPKTVIFHLLYILTVYLLTLCAIGTISYSTYNLSIGNPVNYYATLNSLTFTFIPLVSTTILAHTIMFLISLTFLLFVGVIVMLSKSLGFIIDYNSISYLMWMCMVIVTIIYFQMIWCLTSMVVVVESKWGFEALRRSWCLVKGMRWASLSMLLYFFIVVGLMAWSSWTTVYFNALIGDTKKVVLLTMINSFFLTMYLVASTAANSVFYMKCKAFHGELALEDGEGFDYSNLPEDDDDDDDEVPHLVNSGFFIPV